MPAPLRKGCAILRELPLRHGAAIASHPWLVVVLVPAVCILLGAVACLLPTTLGLGFDPAELAAAGSVISRWSRTELALKSGLRFSREPPAAALPPMPPAEAAEPGMPPPSAPPRPPIRHLSLSFLVSNSSAEGNVLRATVLSPLADALALELADSAEPPVVSPLSLGRLLALTDAPLSEEGGLERLFLAPDETMADWASPPLDTLVALVARVPAARRPANPNPHPNPGPDPSPSPSRSASPSPSPSPEPAQVSATADPLSAAIAELTTACSEHGAPPCGVRPALRCSAAGAGKGGENQGEESALRSASGEDAAAVGACGARCSVQLGGARVDVCALLAELRPAAAEVRALHGALQEAAVAPERSLRALCVVVAWAGRAPVLLRVLPSLREALRLLDAASAARLAAAPDAAAACAARAARLVAQVRVRVRANPNPSPNPSPNPNQLRALAAAAAVLTAAARTAQA